MSESDYPFEVVSWDGQIAVTPAYLARIAGKPEDAPVEESDLDGFDNVIGRFPRVVTALNDNLTEIKVYKVGEIDIPVYIVGRSAEGNWLGVSTRLIQT